MAIWIRINAHYQSIGWVDGTLKLIDYDHPSKYFSPLLIPGKVQWVEPTSLRLRALNMQRCKPSQWFNKIKIPSVSWVLLVCDSVWWHYSLIILFMQTQSSLGCMTSYTDQMGKKLDKVDELQDTTFPYWIHHMYILIPPKWQDKISKSGTPRADEIFGCDIFGVLFKLYSLVLYATENGTPVYSATLNITPQRMVKQMQTQRDAYKTVYDELLKFQEDNCSLEAPSEPWHCVHSWQQKHMWFTLTLRHPLKSFRRRYLRRKAKRSFERFT